MTTSDNDRDDKKLTKTGPEHAAKDLTSDLSGAESLNQAGLDDDVIDVDLAIDSAPEPAVLAAKPPTTKAPRKKVRTGPGCLSRLLGLVGIAVTVALIVAFVAALKFSVLFLAPEEESREAVVSIPDGASMQTIGNILEKEGIIKSANAFVWTIKAKNRLRPEKPVVIKAGEMVLDPSLPVWKTIDLLAKGNYKLYPFTVVEGKNMFEIAQMIEAAGLGAREDFLALCRDKTFINSLGLEAETLEGYLFPETYNFPKGTPLRSIIKTMTDAFFKVWAKYADLAREKGLTRNQAITLASIVEKETGAPQERPMIAGVFFNRLAKGMKLQTDPTIIYGLTEFSGTLTKKDINTNHPYNTYIIPGLPPGPIANPGEAAISAVVKPDIVPYLYFVSKGDGTHEFSRTLAEHNRAVDKYIRKSKQSGKKQSGKR
ncbi:endolytic transglycosylase MltG [Deltaproteobacteria bacterium OttesenSCG-928-M10]|nr:endolytic transglycosylase MltG [Deltaproteobacteria bacterium OttesenSCG-928-M10]